ncbi:MAG: hypothetical protein K6A44_04090 [bacterium]|nr:hypothetical protein [bacterium]
MTKVMATSDVLVSDNGLIYEGMKVSDANKSTELMSVFNFADKDKDGVISRGELDRYNAPIFLQCGHGSRILSACQGGEVATCPNTTQIYAGLKIEETTADGRNLFPLIDLNQDGKITKTEMEKLEDSIIKLEKRNKHEKSKSNMATAFALTAFLPVAVGSLPFLILGGLDAGSFLEFAKFLGSGLGIAGTGMLIGLAIYYFTYGKNKGKRNEALLKDVNSHPFIVNKLKQEPC